MIHAFRVVLIALVLLGAGIFAAGPGSFAWADEGAAPPSITTGEPQKAEVNVTREDVEKQAAEAGQQVLSISLEQAMLLALQNNLDVRVAGYDPRISLTAIDKSLAVFDPTLSGSVNYQSLISPTFSPLTDTDLLSPAGTLHTLENKTVTTDLTLATRATSGGQFGIAWDNTRQDANSLFVSSVSPAYSTKLMLQAIQPLLRNAGVDFNKSNILIAQNNARVSAIQFESSVQDLLLAVDQAYWNLVFTIGDLRAKQTSLEAAQDFLRNNTIKYEAGSLPQIEVTRARARVADRQEAIVTAQAALRNAEDRLRTLLDSRDYPLASEARIFPTDAPTIYAVEMNLEQSIRKALALRPDIRGQIITLESLGVAVMRAKNQLLPEVDLQGTFALNGLGADWSDDYDVLSDAKHHDWSAGVQFAVPIGNRAARADYQSARYQRLKALAQLASLQRTATYGVKQAIRDVRTALQSIDTNKIRVQAAVEQVDAERQKFDAGQSIALDVLDAQDNLQAAQSSYIGSVAVFNIAIANYYRQTGLILQHFGVEVSRPADIELAGGQTLFP